MSCPGVSDRATLSLLGLQRKLQARPHTFLSAFLARFASLYPLLLLVSFLAFLPGSPPPSDGRFFLSFSVMDSFIFWSLGFGLAACTVFTLVRTCGVW